MIDFFYQFNYFARIKVIAFLFLMACCGKVSYSQNFSNKGTDFWTGYGPHEKISSGVSDMTLYFTSDDTATVTIFVGNALFQTLNLTAGTITASGNIPESGAMDARLQNEQVYVNKGIYIHSTSPIVAYAQIWGSKVTATTILFPVKTLGRSYTALNYTQISNTSGMRSFFFVVATEDGTTVEVKPSATTSGGLPVGAWSQQTLNKGDVWLIKGGTDATDLTGSQIRSISVAGGTCKKIAVFSGSQKMSITCSPANASGDNFFQQCFPMAAWGRKYITAPTAGLNYAYNIFRVMINPDSVGTIVKVNGVTLPSSIPGLSPAVTPLTPGVTITFTNSLYYEFVTNGPAKIESNIPVMVAQYISNRDKCGNNFSSIGDPDMIYLSSVEQTIDSIIVSPVPTENNDAVNYLNVVMKTSDIGGFSLRNQLNAIVPATFLPTPADPTYSYTQVLLAAGYSSSVYYKLRTSLGGFNAIAYGYATSESYAYNAGTNVKNLNQVITTANPLGTGFTQVCKGTPTKLALTLSYIPTSMVWQFFSNTSISPNSDVTINSPVPDSTYINTNGITLYVFKLTGLYTFSTTGIFPVRVLANNPSPDGCNGLEQIDFEITVKGGPKSDFSWLLAGCATNPVVFTNLSTDTIPGHSINRWNWNFGDGTGVSTNQNPTYVYGSGGSFNVTLRAINNEGCYTDTVKTVVLAGSPVANFSFSGTMCSGKIISFTDLSTVNPGTLIKWIWDYGDGIKDTVIAPASPNLTHIYLTGGNYTVTLKVENSNGCTSTKTNSVFVGNAPFANFALPGNICLPNGPALFTNLSTMIGGFPITYIWDFGDASPFDNAINPVHTYLTTGPFFVKLTATSGACSKDTVKTFSTLYQKPQVAITVSPENCLNTLTVFADATTTFNSTITNRDWDFGDGTPHSSTQNPTHLYLTAGTYQVKLIIATDKGCIDSVTKQVVINQLPTAGFIYSFPPCAGNITNVLFTSSAVANSGTLTEWQWDFGDGNSLTRNDANPILHAYTSGATYTATLKVKTDKGCFSTVFSQVIIIRATPVANFTLPGNLCLPNASASFINTTTINDGTLPLVTYVWDFGDGSPTGTATNPTHIYTGVGPYTVTLTAKSNNNCSHTVSKIINTIYAQPLAGFNAPAEVCFNTNVFFTDASAAAGSTVTGWQWNFGDPASGANNTSTLQNPSHLFSGTGTFTVSLIATNAVGCTSVQFLRAIDINRLPAASFSFPPVRCSGSTISFTDASVANSGNLQSWSWDFGDPSSGANNTSILQFPTHSFAAPGNYTVSLTVVNTKGCISTLFSTVVSISPVPKSDFTVGSICVPNGLAQFTDQSSIATGSISGWVWDFGDGSGTSGFPNPTHNYLTGGVKNVQLTVISALGCSKDTTIAVTAYDVPTAAYTLGGSLCSNEDVIVTNTSAVTGFGTVNKVELYWDYINDPTNKITDNAPVAGKTYSNQYPVFGTPATKTYRVLIRAFSGTGCSKDYFTDVVIKAAPQVQFNPMAPVCQEIKPFILSSAGDIFFNPGIGVYSGPGVTVSPLFNPAAAGVGTHTIRYTYTALNGCQDYDDQAITVFPTPLINLGPDKKVIEGDIITLVPVLVNGNNLTYVWSPLTYLTTVNTLPTPQAKPTDDITYTVVVTSQDGCSARDDIFLKVVKDFIVPNVFSPNKDGINDFWKIDNLELYPSHRIEVFNRYGQMLFETTDYSKPWDGTYKGKELPVGTYYYIIELGGARQPKKGYVTIIR
jgi:gliding motility-associated-like protein